MAVEHFSYHCSKQFAFRGSNMSLTYHLWHKHPLKYQDVADSDRQKSSERLMTNFLSRQTNEPVSGKLSADLKVSLAHRIASSGRPTLILKDDGLRTALQNQAYNLPSRHTIGTMIAEKLQRVYREKLAELKKVVESIHSIVLLLLLNFGLRTTTNLTVM